ncbi:MAG: (2Fe-2S)-binding protein [Actinomycetota bacterium]|jgi:aerobic carbon-monoxide dehydrogenase small subunit|nr:(2Fe-2S)-binding protein [Actinomycetota bacterium]
MERKKTIHVTVNGEEYEREVEVRKTLADFLREDLGLRGTHLGCEHGVCGACTVLFNDSSVRSCIIYAAQADGTEILTIEGLAPAAGPLHPIQEAFRDKHGLQCGFCTPGFVLAALDFLVEAREPSEEEIREAISGNLCRCTGYQGIVEAIRAADANWER